MSRRIASNLVEATAFIKAIPSRACAANLHLFEDTPSFAAQDEVIRRNQSGAVDPLSTCEHGSSAHKVHARPKKYRYAWALELPACSRRLLW
jgi:hypothetical protein